MARVLGRTLAGHGFRCAGWFGRNKEEVAGLAAGVQAEMTGLIGSGPLPEADVTFIAVSDDAVAEVAEQVAEAGCPRGAVIMHTSGVHDHGVLALLAAKGAQTGSFHPLQTFTGVEDAARFRGITIGIEGMPGALAVGHRLADDLLATAVEIDPDRKALYHAAAVMAGNHAIAMLAAAADLWQRATSDQQGAVEALGPLTRQSIENALSTDPGSALTGPIVRGDLGTLGKHLQALSVHADHLTPMYASVVTETIHLAMKSGRLSTEKAVELLDLLSRSVRPETEES